jgi:hypothetical protein
MVVVHDTMQDKTSRTIFSGLGLGLRLGVNSSYLSILPGNDASSDSSDILGAVCPKL